MTQFTPLSLAALAVFAEEPRHAYEVYCLMRQRREDISVKLNAGTLYHAVNRMAAAGLLEAVETGREGNRPERTVYRITGQGRECLAAEVRDLIARPAKEYPRFAVGIGEAHNLPRDEVAALLTQRIDVLADELAAFHAAADGLRAAALPERYVLDLAYTRAMLEAELAWCRDLVERLRAGLDWTGRPQLDLAATGDEPWRMFSSRVHPVPEAPVESATTPERNA